MAKLFTEQLNSLLYQEKCQMDTQASLSNKISKEIIPALEPNNLKSNFTNFLKTLKKIEFGQKALTQLIEKNVIPST